MASDFEIGRVISVDTAQVTIELNSDLKALMRNTYEGPQEIGRINSYVVIPVGARRLIAMVVRVVLAEEAEVSVDRTMVTLPKARRIMKATLIGTIDGKSYTQGVSLFPVLDTPVCLVTSEDLATIFDRPDEKLPGSVDPQKPGFCVHLGSSPIFESFPIKIDPDAFFGKHAAVLGSTGSGKSCTIASLLQSLLEMEGVKQTHIIVLDTNGEYRSAFQKQNESGQWEDLGTHKCLYIPTDPKKASDRFVIPYWFMNADDYVRLFRASQGVQRPVLLESLRLARNETVDKGVVATIRETLMMDLNTIWSQSGSSESKSKSIRDLADGLLKWADFPDLTEGWAEIATIDPSVTKDKVTGIVSKVKEEAQKHIDKNIKTNEEYPKVIPADARKTIRDTIEPLVKSLGGKTSGAGIPLGVSADSPIFFDKRNFRTRHIEQVLRREESGGARARDFSGTMLLRIDRLFQDSRFDFLLGPVGTQLPDAEHVLATFIRDILGLKSCENPIPPLSDDGQVLPDMLPFYDRQRSGAQGHQIVILDLSLLAAEVLENVTALIGRLVLEFLQRFGESGGENARGSLPVILVLEEAQNYIHDSKRDQDESISRTVFERVAREGRKFGLGLVVASQRPSELSKTVLSQCSSFIVHRLQNPEDLRYFKEIVPGIYGPLLDQLPSLASQTALVMGECVRAPALVKIREARPVPRSRDPKFYAHWTSAETAVDVERVCSIWEENSSSNTEPGIVES